MSEVDVPRVEQGNDKAAVFQIYESPKLVALGDVREFTLGGSTGRRESGNTNTFKT